MHRAAFAAKTRAELLEYAVALNKDAPEAIGKLTVVRTVFFIFIERDWVFDLVRHLVDGHRKTQFVEALRHRSVKIGYRPRFQFNRSPLAIARVDAQLVIDEIKVDLERARAVRDRRSR